jgi:hypothetical protein
MHRIKPELIMKEQRTYNLEQILPPFQDAMMPCRAGSVEVITEDYEEMLPDVDSVKSMKILDTICNIGESINDPMRITPKERGKT